jgi:hypothetical protein
MFLLIEISLAARLASENIPHIMRDSSFLGRSDAAQCREPDSGCIAGNELVIDGGIKRGGGVRRT